MFASDYLLKESKILLARTQAYRKQSIVNIKNGRIISYSIAIHAGAKCCWVVEHFSSESMLTNTVNFAKAAFTRATMPRCACESLVLVGSTIQVTRLSTCALGIDARECTLDFQVLIHNTSIVHDTHVSSLTFYHYKEYPSGQYFQCLLFVFSVKTPTTRQN